MAAVKTHDGGDTVAIFIAEDAARGALEDADEIFESLGGVRGCFFQWLFSAVFIKVGVKPANEFTHYVTKHDIIIIA